VSLAEIGEIGEPSDSHAPTLPPSSTWGSFSTHGSPIGCNFLSHLTKGARCGITILTTTLPDGGQRRASTEHVLRLTLFGEMQAQDAAGRSVLPRSRKTRAVLAMLALAGPRKVLRTQVTGLLWSRRENEQARASLRQSVHELRSVLGPRIGMLLRADRNHLQLLDDQLWVDARALLAATVSQPDGLAQFQQTFLDDLTGLDSTFDHWLTDERQRLTRHARSVADGVLAVQCDTDATISSAERLLFIDPCHEGAWQALIRARMDQGDRAAARLAFDRCTAILASAGLSPSPVTEELTGTTPCLRLGARGDLRPREETREIRLSVLPPRALDGDRLDALSLGLAEEITAALSRFRWISCVDGTLLTTNGGLAKPAGQAWQRLDLDFLLDSTLQRTGNRIRVLARLLDVRAGGKVVWARRFDRVVDDVLTLQSEIAAEISAQIDPELLIREAERLVSRGLDEPNTYDLILRAIPAIYRLERSGFHAAGEVLAAALAIEPDNAAAHAWWAYWHVLLVGQGWARDPVSATRRAGELAERAVTLDPSDARALALIGHVRGFLYKRPAEACALHERAISLNPNLPMAWCFSGAANSYLGRHEEAIAQINQAQRLSPHDPHAFFFDTALMLPHLLSGDFETVVTLGRRAIEFNPGFSATYKGYLATLGHLGRDSEAARVLTRLLVLEPGFSIRNAVERSPMMRREDLALYAEGLRRGGLREG
jgi:DNA-binding SARP family transcriptional activator/tetratricopeptide (TPR) repeat protein